MKKQYIIGIFVIIFLVAAVSGVLIYKNANKREMTVGIVPYWRIGETHLGFEQKYNLQVDRFLEYYDIVKYDSYVKKRIMNFLYNISINRTPEIELSFVSTHPLAEIKNGTYDKQLYDLAKELKTYTDKTGKIVYIRPLGEPYGDWNPWGIFNKNNSKEDFIPAFRHIVDILRSTGNENLRIQLNIGGLGEWSRVNRFNNEPYSKYYPGDDYVDEWQIDVYNLAIWVKWTSFHDLVINDYNEIAAISPKPAINIGEVASGTYGGNKSQWIKDMFVSAICDFPRMNNIDYFNSNGVTVNEKTNSALSTPEHAEAFRWGLQLFDDYNNGDRSMCNE